TKIDIVHVHHNVHLCPPRSFSNSICTLTMWRLLIKVDKSKQSVNLLLSDTTSAGGDHMEWLNYHHLLYFWTVVRAGSIQKASEELRVSPPAISAQLKLLESQLGEKLLTRSGRRLVVSEVGATVFSYAEEIFGLGRELVDVVKNRPVGRPLRFDVGIVDVMPKVIVQSLLEPALHLREQVRIVCREASSDQLLGRLATHELDVVLSDSPVDPTLKIRAYSHLL